MLSSNKHCLCCCFHYSAAHCYEYTGFYCYPTLQVRYLAMTILFGFVGFICAMLPKFGQKAYRPIRAVMFIGIGLSGIIPMAHFTWLVGGFPDIVWSLVLMGALYIGGAVLYACRVPERCCPGRFDIVGSSHQLFHVCVCVAVFTLYNGLLKFFQWRKNHSCHDGSVYF